MSGTLAVQAVQEILGTPLAVLLFETKWNVYNAIRSLPDEVALVDGCVEMVLPDDQSLPPIIINLGHVELRNARYGDVAVQRWLFGQLGFEEFTNQLARNLEHVRGYSLKEQKFAPAIPAGHHWANYNGLLVRRR